MFLTLIDQSTNLPGDVSPLADVEKFHLKNQKKNHHTSEVSSLIFSQLKIFEMSDILNYER